MASKMKKMPSWTGVKANMAVDQSRKAVARKIKEKYKTACKKLGKYPLTCILNQLENTEMELPGQELGLVNIKLLAASLMKVDYVSSLNLRDNCMGDEGAFLISDLIPRNTSISHLNVADNDIGNPGLKALTAALGENILLTKLDISGNNITDSGALIIADLLEMRTGLLELRLNHNNIGERGAIPIGNALGNNDILELLDLSWNNIRGKGAISISHSLKHNKCLQTLNLAWNGFAKEGAKAMGDALKDNTHLKDLDLTNNRIDGNAMATLMLGKNPFNSEVAKYLLQLLEKAEKSAITHLELTDVSVDEDFMDVLERLSGLRNLNINHGKLVRKIPEKPFEPPPLPPRDPLDAMFEFKYENGYRTLDLLNKMDKDNNMTIDRDELKYGLMDMDVIADDEQIDDLIDRLDTNKDGHIDYCELVAGEKLFGSRQRRHMNMQTVHKIASLAKSMMKMKISQKIQESQENSENENTKERKMSESKSDKKAKNPKQ